MKARVRVTRKVRVRGKVMAGLKVRTRVRVQSWAMFSSLQS
jgi:hypothetical protein